MSKLSDYCENLTRKVETAMKVAKRMEVTEIYLNSTLDNGTGKSVSQTYLPDKKGTRLREANQLSCRKQLNANFHGPKSGRLFDERNRLGF
jgi:hypothetical protein